MLHLKDRKAWRPSKLTTCKEGPYADHLFKPKGLPEADG